ncbi:MAG: hypothetical protein NC191_07260 [Muribaculaceae bacterium]|nr:hypothetical protein [Muribaculaceae bacterium]
MKKIISAILFLIFVGISMGAANALTIEEVIYNKEQVAYNPETGLWRRYVAPKKKIIQQIETDLDLQDDIVEEAVEEIVDPSIILTRRATPAKGAYTVFLDEKKNPVIFPNSNFEYIQDGRLILVDNHRLKYYEMVYQDEQFAAVKLTDTQLKELFEDAEIVKISEFKNDKYTTTKKFFGMKKILLVNDTERAFYKYSYRPAKVQQTEVKGFITTPKTGKFLFSHYGDKDGSIEITVTRR